MTTGPHPASTTLHVPVHVRAVCAVILTLALLLAMALVALPAGADPGDQQPVPDQEVPELHVELTDISPAVLRPGEDLTIRGTVQNVSAETVDQVSLDLIMQRHALSSRAAVQAWHNGTSSSRIGTATPVTEELDVDLEPGQSVSFRITMPSGPTFAERSPWGPRGIEVEASGANGTGWARSLLLWFPEESPLAAPAELSVLVPLTPTGAEWHQAVADDAPVAEVAATRLLPLVHAADDDITWALDPALLETQPVVPPGPIQSQSADPTAAAETGEESTAPDPEPGPEPGDGETNENSTTGAPDDGDDADPSGPDDETADPALRDVLVREAAGRDLVKLAYADADLSALSHAGDLSLWRMGENRGTALLDHAGLEPLPGVHWPAGSVDGTALGALAGEGAQAVVAPEHILTDVPGAALDAPTLVHTTSGPVPAVAPDARISGLLAATDEAGQELDPLISRQLLLADSAAAVRQHPQSQPGLLVTLPRDVTADHLEGNLTELLAAPWLEPTNMSGLLGHNAASERTVATPVVGDGDRLPPGAIADLESQHDAVRDLARTVEASQPLLDQVEPAILTGLSAAWRGHTDDRGDLLARVDDLIEQVTGAVRIETGSSVLLINHSGDLPVAVANDLPVQARVTVALQPQDPRLRAAEPVETVLDAHSITTVRVPIQAVANGNVDLDVHILDEPGGRDVGQGASFMVRVRADWEDIGTAVVAGLLVVGFVIGMVRTIRSGRRFNPGADTGASTHEDRMER